MTSTATSGKVTHSGCPPLLLLFVPAFEGQFRDS